MRPKTGIFMVLASFMCFRFTPEIRAQCSVAVRVANPQTDFGFINWNSGPQQFYQLTVP